MMEGESGLLACIKTILGERILPSCELAMTTIPTEVALRAETREPVLKMSAGVRGAFTRAEAGLKKVLAANGHDLDRDLGAYPYLKKLPPNSAAVVWASCPCARRVPSRFAPRWTA
jgi:hypothetical protein